MANLNLLMFLNAYSDSNPSNSPLRNNFKWNRGVNGLAVENPYSLEFTLAPGETRSLFSGTRTLTQDNTTQYSIALKPFTTNTYVLSWVGGVAPSFRTLRASGLDNTSAINVTLNGTVATLTSAPSVAASFIGQVAGMTSDITLTANTAGSTGNSISLAFDGVLTVSGEITAWNTANPSNQVTLTSGVGTQVPNNTTNINLAGGLSRTQLDTTAIQVGDQLSLGSNFNPLNQGNWQIISKTSTSLSIVNPSAAAEGPISVGATPGNQFRAFGAAGVQVGDILNISGGFSPVTQGNYPVTAVTDSTVEFLSAALLPQEGPITTQAIAVYSSAKRLIYLEADQKVGVLVNGSLTNNIEPMVNVSCGCPTNHGFLLLTSTVYSLSVTNNGLSEATLYLASVE